MNMNKKQNHCGFLIDLDGTIYHGEKVISGAQQWIEQLNKEGIPYQFVTNNSSASPEVVAERLRKMGIQATPDQVSTSACAAAAYIAQLKPEAKVFAIGEEGLIEALNDAGLSISGSDNTKVDFVVQGIDRSLSYEKVRAAVRFIRAGAQSIMTNPDKLLPGGDGLIPGAGSIGAMIEAAAGIEPTVIGKPSSILMDFAIRRLGRDITEPWMVGDNIATDIAAGLNASCQTILVLTGLTTEDNYDFYCEQASCKPHYICKDLFSLQQLTEEIAKRSK